MAMVGVAVEAGEAMEVVRQEEGAEVEEVVVGIMVAEVTAEAGMEVEAAAMVEADTEVEAAAMAVEGAGVAPATTVASLDTSLVTAPMPAAEEVVAEAEAAAVEDPVTTAGSPAI